MAHLCLCVGEFLLFVFVKAGGFLWLDWEGIIVKNVVDNVFFLLVFFFV